MFALRFIRNVVLKLYGDADDLDPEVGDLIEMNRIWYQHWAVYIGDGEIVHLTGNSETFFSSSSGGKATVRKERLKDVVKRSARVNNSSTTWKYGLTIGILSKVSLGDLKPFPPAEIRKRALSRVGNTKFHVTNWNCEHFAHWCRFGVEFSHQADNAALPLAP